MWIIAIAAVLTLVGGVVYRNIQGFIADTALVTHTHEVLETLNGVMALLADAESGQRGYVITARIEYLEPYHAALQQIESNLRHVARLATDNPEQRDRAKQLAATVQKRLQTMHAIVGARAKGFEPAQRLVLTDEGRREMNGIRSLVEQMDAEERALLVRRNALARESARNTIFTAGIGLALALALMLLMLEGIRREGQRREAAESRLQTSNAELTQSLDHVQRMGRESSVMSSMADLLQSCRSVDEARPVITRALRQLLPDGAGAVCLLNSSQNLMETVLEWNTVADQGLGTQTTFTPDQCWALRRGRLHVSSDVHSGQLCQHLTEPPPPSYLCLPMMAQGEAMGVMFVQGNQPAPSNDERLGLIRSVSEQIALALANLKLQESLRTQSIRDPLTGLFNRRYLEASLERELARAKRHQHSVCVIMMDVDHFKRFNDTFGHEAGDAVLVEFAGVLKSLSREDDIACRFGGEEFTLILPETNAEKARERAELVRVQVSKLRLEHRRRSLGNVTVSLGVAVYPEDSTSADGLVQLADAALYQAKQAGRDRVMLAAEMNAGG